MTDVLVWQIDDQYVAVERGEPRHVAQYSDTSGGYVISPDMGFPRLPDERWIIARFEYPYTPGVFRVSDTLYRGESLEAAKDAAQRHYAARMRARRWAKYMRDHEPPQPAGIARQPFAADDVRDAVGGSNDES